jgi:hypothetical protein
MALDKKHYDSGTIDSAQELDAYGVWVKSEPQDFTAGMAETADFDAGAMPYEADFDAGFDDLGTSGFGFGVADEDAATGFPEMDIEDSGFGAEAYSEPISEEASNRLLMKIAGELSSIKSELNSLKKEFAEIRAESGSGAGEGEKRGGFFAEDDDEKIALTGDEMDHFLSSTDFSEEDGLGYNTQREADEAALKEISDQNEIFASGEEPSSADGDASDENADEEIEIDFDNLGIDLDEGAEAEAETLDEFPPIDDEPPFDEPSLEAADSDLDASSFDTSSFDDALSEETGDDFEELTPLEDSEELRDLRLEGASPLTPPPDNSVYLETDPFALDDSDFEGTPLEANALKEDAVLDTDLAEESAAQDTALSESSFSEDISSDLSIDGDSDLSGEISSTDDLSEDISIETAAQSDGISEELSIGDLDDGDGLSFDDSSFDMGFDDDDNFSLDSSSSTEDLETSAETESAEAAAVEPADVELSLDDSSLDSDLSLDSGSAGELDDSDISFEAGAAEISGELDDSDLSFDAGPLELSATGLDDTDFSFDDGDSLEIAEEASAEEVVEEASVEEASIEEASEQAETAAGAEQEFDADSLDLTDAVIDEPDLSAGIVEAPLEEPVLGDISFNDDISLDMDDFGSGIVETGDSAEHDNVPALSARAADDDDSLAQIIPEGFEVDAKDAAVSMDDDLEAFDDLALTAGTSLADDSAADLGGRMDVAISPGLKGELKSVLAYMDHLLESLPEEKIEEFAKSEYFDTYKKIFKELGLV